MELLTLIVVHIAFLILAYFIFSLRFSRAIKEAKENQITKEFRENVEATIEYMDSALDLINTRTNTFYRMLKRAEELTARMEDLARNLELVDDPSESAPEKNTTGASPKGRGGKKNTGKKNTASSKTAGSSSKKKSSGKGNGSHREASGGSDDLDHPEKGLDLEKRGPGSQNGYGSPRFTGEVLQDSYRGDPIQEGDSDSFLKVLESGGKDRYEGDRDQDTDSIYRSGELSARYGSKTNAPNPAKGGAPAETVRSMSGFLGLIGRRVYSMVTGQSLPDQGGHPEPESSGPAGARSTLPIQGAPFQEILEQKVEEPLQKREPASSAQLIADEFVPRREDRFEKSQEATTLSGAEDLNWLYHGSTPPDESLEEARSHGDHPAPPSEPPSPEGASDMSSVVQKALEFLSVAPPGDEKNLLIKDLHSKGVSRYLLREWSGLSEGELELILALPGKSGRPRTRRLEKTGV